MTSTTATDEAGLVVAITSFARGYRVVRAGTRLRASDPRVLADPHYFVPEATPDHEVAHQARVMREQRVHEVDRPLTKKQLKHQAQLDADREARSKKGTESWGWFWSH